MSDPPTAADDDEEVFYDLVFASPDDASDVAIIFGLVNDDSDDQRG